MNQKGILEGLQGPNEHLKRQYLIAAIWDLETTKLVVTTATSQGLGDEMDEPMQDVCTDPIKDGAEETQYVSVEIDTQATDGYDDALLDEEVLKQTSDIALRSPPVSNPGPRYTVPLDQDEPAMDFRFAKAAHNTPIFRPAKPNACATTAPSSSGLNPPSEICGGAYEKSRPNNTTNEPLAIGEAKEFTPTTIENNEAGLMVEVGPSQRPALKQKDSNARCSTNIPSRQQKRGVSFATGSINNGRQHIQSLRPQQTRQPTSTPPPFPDIQSQTKKRRGSAIARIPQHQPPFPSQKEHLKSGLSEPYVHQSSTTQSGSMTSTFEEQALVQEGVLQQKEAVSLCTAVDHEFKVGQVSEQYLPASSHAPPFASKSETRAHTPTATSNRNYEQSNSHTLFNTVADQTRRASICSKDNDRIGKLVAANMPFPEATYPASPRSDYAQIMHEKSRPMLANKSGRKRKSGAVDPYVNLQNKAQISPKRPLKEGKPKDSTDGRGATTQPLDGGSNSGETSDSSDELHQSIQAYMEKGKQKLFDQMQEKDAKINEVSKKNEDYKENINELERTNASLSERFAAMREEADALNERIISQLEEYKSLADFVTQNKSQTADCQHEVENMRTSLTEANNRLEGLQLHQKKSRAELMEVRVLAISQMESLESLREDRDKCKAELQQEREQSVLLQKELHAQHQEIGLKDTIKDLLDGHCLGVTDRLSEAISNTDKENQSRLSDCLRLLESTTGKPPQAPKEVLEMKGLVETLSTSISDRLQSADDGSDALRNAGTEVMEALKARVETLFEVQNSKKELDERISSLQVANARLEVATRGHEERILELQTQLTAKESELDRCRAESNVKSEWNRTQLDDRQKELDKCRENLTTREDELRKAQAKIEAGSVSQNELTILQATHAKTASELADVTKNMRGCEVALAEQGEMASTMQAQNTDLEERLESAEQKVVDVERELSQFKASASESLKKQRMEAETDRRKSLESEKRSHVQKASNLQRLRVEAEAMAEGLKAESKKLKEDVKKKEQLILALEAEKTTLEGKSKEQTERLAQLEKGSISQVAEYHSLIEALKSTAFDITQLETKLKQNEEKAVAESRMVNGITESVGGIIRQYVAVMSRLESYERIEAKVQDYCRKSGISFEANALDAILEILAGFKSRSPVARIPSRNNSIDNGTAALHVSNGQPASFTPKVVRLQVPNSPEILDSQMLCPPSSSPLPRRGVRSIAPQRGPANATLSVKESFETTTRKFTTEVTRFRASRTTKESEDARRNSPLHGLEIEDSQDKGGKSACSPSCSSLSELNDSDFDEIDDCYMLASGRPGNEKGREEETARGQRPTAAPKKAEPKMQANKPLKGCLKKTTPRNDSADDKSMLSNDTIKTPLSDPTSMKPSTGRQISKARLASLSEAHDSSKMLPPNNNPIRGGGTPRSDSKQSITSLQSESSVSKFNLRKRTMCSVSSGMKSEPPTKQVRLSLPGRDFHAVSPFVPESIKRRESSGPSLESQ
ncbi:hypothetical protein V500_07371 [Pseudogymnoascus sp. VKM F-4518 (FW-2643)]|nr:hypothetical protein V500_07371 [Pseudogymnoascus sp. VKM F-4518 (FW-2643)]